MEKYTWTNDEYHGVSETGVLIKPVCNSEVRVVTCSYSHCGRRAHVILCLGFCGAWAWAVFLLCY